MNKTDNVHAIIRQAKDNYIDRSVKQGKYVDWAMHETIETIDAYSNSKHTSGLYDSLGREKPFFNIVTAAVNIWYRATDIDRKNIKFTAPDSQSVFGAFVAGVLLQRWMDDNKFGQFLNTWGRTLAKYGSAIIKFVEKDGELIPSVVAWNKFIPDSVDFNSIPKIERLYKTPAQLTNMATKGHPDYAGYDLDQAKALISSSQESRKTQDDQQQDQNPDFLELFEVHGQLSKAQYKQSKGQEVLDGDEEVFFQQMHVVSFVATGEKGSNGSEIYDDFTLYCGKEKQDPYMLTHLIEEDGRTLSIGAVEYLFDAQWMQNHSIKQWKDQLDLASKLIFQTADSNYVGRNVLTAIETGDIMIHDVNKPLTLINNAGHDVTSIQAFASVWKTLSQEITSTPDALRGQTMPSGTPYRLAAALQQEAGSLFELMTENKGLHLEDMLNRFVIPNLKKKLNNTDEISAILDANGIKTIDSMYVPNEAVRRYNKKVIKKMLSLKPEDMMNGTLPQPFNKETEQGAVQEELSTLGNQRFLKPDEFDKKTWKEIIPDSVWDNLTIEITNENKDKNAVLTTLSSMLQTFAQADPQFSKLIRDKIALETGVISPLELSTTPPTPLASPPTGGGAGALQAKA